MLTPFTAPPKDYYQNNCAHLFSFVLDNYDELLEAQEQKLLHAYLGASNDAQRLFARLLTRKGPYFRLSSCAYDEVDDSLAAIEELSRLDIVQINPAAPADHLLNLLKKDELLHIDPVLEKRLTKPMQVQRLLDRTTDPQLRSRVFAFETIIGVSRRDMWNKTLRIYFGAAPKDWSAFVLRDLGQIRYEKVALSAQLASKEEIEEEQRLRQLAALTHRLEEVESLTVDLYQQLTPVTPNRWLKRLRDRAILRIANHCERLERYEHALEYYQAVDVHPARERQVRILTKQSRPEAEMLLEQIREQPVSEEELQFALRFGKRNAGYQPTVENYCLDDYPNIDPDESIEFRAAQILVENNLAQKAFHVENSLVRTLTGLLYWPVIFAPLPGAFTNPFQGAPNDMYQDDFVSSRIDQIAALEESLRDDHAFRQHIELVAQTKKGIANDLVNWRLLEELRLDDLFDAIPTNDIRKLTHFLIRRLSERRAGLPDLFVIKPGGNYCLVEVKGPGDQLQPGQRIWFKHLDRMSIPNYVMKLK